MVGKVAKSTSIGLIANAITTRLTLVVPRCSRRDYYPKRDGYARYSVIEVAFLRKVTKAGGTTSAPRPAVVRGVFVF